MGVIVNGKMDAIDACIRQQHLFATQKDSHTKETRHCPAGRICIRSTFSTVTAVYPVADMFVPHNDIVNRFVDNAFWDGALVLRCAES